MSERDRAWLVDGALALLLAAGAFALYARTLAPTVLAGDGGEFQFVPYLLGVAHPTGYPLYTLLGWAWSHLLPVGDVAYRMNLFSAFCGALAVGGATVAAGLLLRQAYPTLAPAVRRLLAALAAAILAVTPTLWSQAVMAEVYGLHILLVVLTLTLVLAWGERRMSCRDEDMAALRGGSKLPHSKGQRRLSGGTEDPTARRFLLGAAFCFGLGLAHHATTLLLAPGIGAYVWLVDRTTFREWKRMLLPAALWAALPLLLYGYIPWRAPHTPYLQQALTADRELVLYENSLTNLFRFIAGGPFGGYLDFSVDLGARLQMAWGFLQAEVGWPGVLLAGVGLLGLALSRRWALLALTGVTYGAIVAFNLVYTIGDIYVLFIPSYLIVALWIAAGVGALARWAPQRRLISLLVVIPFFALPVGLAAANYADLDQSQNTQARARWESILAQPLPQGAILVTNDRNNIMPMWYFQYVEGVRPDLLGLFPLITEEIAELGDVLDLALSTGRPTYLIKEMPGVEVKVQVEPADGLWRVRGPAVVGEPVHEVEKPLANAVVLRGYDRSSPGPRPGDEFPISLYWEALRPLTQPYHTFVHLVDGQGQAIAKSDRQPGGVFYPTTLWRPGERLRDDHRLTLPADTPEGIYDLWVGMYALNAGGGLEPLGEAIRAGHVAVKWQVPTEPGEVGRPLEAQFGDELALLGYDAALEGEALQVTLTWRCLRPPAVDYSVFVHLVDAGGKVVSQQDGWPQEGAYPLSVCDSGEVIVDRRLLPLPDGLPVSSTQLHIGLYRLESGQRLPVSSGGDAVKVDLELGP